MNIITAITSEERKLETEIKKLQKQLDGLKSAERALRGAGHNGTGGAQKRVLSPEARARISRAAKRRWAKARLGTSKAA